MQDTTKEDIISKAKNPAQKTNSIITDIEKF